MQEPVAGPVEHHHLGLARLDESCPCFCIIATLFLGRFAFFESSWAPELDLDSADESGYASKGVGHPNVGVGHLIRKLQQDSPHKLGQHDSLIESIREEGLHIPDVDYVFFYEAVPSEIRTIQRRGRTGRTRIGKVTVLMAEGTVDEAYYHSSLGEERSMHAILNRVSQTGIKTRSRKTTLIDYS